MAAKPGWRNQYKAAEQRLMVFMDRYSELARAIGFAGDPMFGDVHEPHEKIIARAKELYEANKQETLH